MTPREILEMPTSFFDSDDQKCHESILRSYHIVEYMLEMIERGDSKETIKEMVDLLRKSIKL